MSKPQWVKLYLVPQTDNTDMPKFVVGILTSETPGNYVLNPMIRLPNNEEGMMGEATEEGELINEGMNFINKTYVWRCQVLDSEPDTESMKQDAIEEGLGGGLG